MALTISQALAVSFETVMADKRKAANQWSEQALLRWLNKLGGIKRQSFGTAIEIPLDYTRNAQAGFLATDMATVTLVKTEVLTAASFSSGRLGVPITWSFEDEAKNDSDAKKIDFVAALLDNAKETHDYLLEQALFTTSTEGVLGLQTLVKDTDGAGTVGGINSSTETWWKNNFDTYASNGSDIEAALTEADNETSKGSGSKSGVNLIVSGAEANAIYEAQLQANQRYIDTSEGSAGFKTLAFRQKPYIFSQHGGTNIFGINTKSLFVVVHSQAYMTRGETYELENQFATSTKMFTMVQAVVNNRSRQFVLKQV